jgi:queuine tRNA-ribosyltransferase
MAGEMLGPVLLSAHNLTYYQRLMSGAREAIERDAFVPYLERKLSGWRKGD